MTDKNSPKSNDTDARNIADLCSRCGQCCMAIATDFTYEELVEMSKSNKQEAKVFTDFFKKYPTIADARKVAPEHVAIVLQHKKLPEDSAGDEAAFYYCEKIDSDKKCTAYEERPTCCAMAPKDGWSLMPPKCGYAGWQYQEKERLKGLIRSMREKIYEIETLEGEDAFVTELNMSLKDMKKKVYEKTLPFVKYGSAGW